MEEDAFIANEDAFAADAGFVWADGGVHLRVRQSDVSLLDEFPVPALRD